MDDDSFQSAFEAEMSDAPIPTNEEAANAEASAPVETPEPETPEETPETPETPTADEPAVVDEPKFATKDDVKEAMREYNSETTGRISKVTGARDEIIEKLHPEGIHQDITDTYGNVIKTAQDIVDRGLLKENGDEYTYEEAASFMLNAQQQMAKNVEELHKWAEDVAEKNISLIESHERVMSQWSDVLSTIPKADVEKLANTYMATQVKWDETNSYITEMGMSPEDFYTLALSPYRQLNEAMSAKTQLEEQNKKYAQGAEQNERMGIPQRGSSESKSNTGDANLDALLDELKKG